MEHVARFLVCAAGALASSAAGCAHRADATAPGSEVTFEVGLSPATDPGTETYLCYVFELGALGSSPLESIAWQLPTAGPVTVHHVSLYAIPTAMPEGPLDCATASFGVGPRFSSYTPGQAVTALPDGVALKLPGGTLRIGAEVHVLRSGVGVVPPGHIVMRTPARAPEHLAVWMEALVHVPDLPPRAALSSTRRCSVGADVHVVSAWPHMHRMGRTFDSAVVRANGETSPFLRVDPWDFSHQLLYPADLVLHAGDGVDLTCAWENTSDVTIHDGLYSTNEMCSFAFIAWPADAAHCAE